LDHVRNLDTEQMIEVDRAMVEDYRIELIQMMENVGHCLAVLARERFLGDRLEVGPIFATGDIVRLK